MDAETQRSRRVATVVAGGRPGWVPQPARPHRLGRIAGVAAIVASGALGLSACSSGPSSPASAATSSSSNVTHAATDTAARRHETVTIKNFAFHPANFSVTPGATITVTNKDSVTHTFTADGGAFDTGNISPGKTKTVRAPKKRGKYPYRCEIHQFMTGTLTVK